MPEEPQPRRRAQFTLRTMILYVTAICIISAVIAQDAYWGSMIEGTAVGVWAMVVGKCLGRGEVTWIGGGIRKVTSVSCTIAGALVTYAWPWVVLGGQSRCEPTLVAFGCRDANRVAALSRSLHAVRQGVERRYGLRCLVNRLGCDSGIPHNCVSVNAQDSVFTALVPRHYLGHHVLALLRRRVRVVDLVYRQAQLGEPMLKSQFSYTAAPACSVVSSRR